MGWTGLHREKGITHKEWFEREFEVEIVECATKGMTFYAAMRDPRQPELGTFGYVVLMQYQRGHHNFYYKNMHENMGPYRYDAPAKVLDALTPTENEYALEWREGCRAALAKRATAKAIKKGTRGPVGVVGA